LGVETFLDEQVLTRASIAFNCGLQTESIVMQAKDLAKLTEAKLGKFAKS
jgi:prolyl-tRNA editing enzyme YbaK/EbsC (Cys-tRNA(Pro) deacylase)